MGVSNVIELVLCFAFCWQAAGAYRYLVIQPVSGYSHHAVPAALAYGLARKGHDVTMITPALPPKEQLPNYQHIRLVAIAEAAEAYTTNLFEDGEKSAWEVYMKLQAILLMIANAVFEDPGVGDLLHSNRTFDAVICEVFQADSLYGFSEHFNAPLIGVTPFGDIAWNTDMVGSPSPASYIPNSFLPIASPMNLQQRIGNLLFLIYERLLLEWQVLPNHEAVYRKYFPNAKRSLREVRSSAALVLLNTHFSLGLTRPYMPNHIEVGGMYINRERKPLPTELKRFMDEAEEGVIYFSMGSYLRSKLMPLAQRKAILNSFRALKQRVVWKFEDPHMEDKPDNVYITPWLPQDDVLAHPKTRLFITHGGLLSMIEAVYHGVPVLGLPIYGDQPWNMARAEKNGYGFTLDFKELTEYKFRAAIERVLRPSYKEEMSMRSAQYRDQPLEPLQLAIYWAERVARHGNAGAERLHCSGLQMNFIAYHNIDAWLLLFGALTGVVLLLVAIFRVFLSAVRFLLGKSSPNSKKEKLKKH